MDPMTAYLLAMQAAGLVSSFIGAHDQQKMIRLGRTLETEQLETNLKAIKVQSLDASVTELKQLRANMGTQIAINAARGTGRGSSAWALTFGQGAYENDERKRRMNLLAKESDLRANGVLSGLHSLQAETELGRNLLSKTFDTLQTTSLLGPQANPTPRGGSGVADKQWVKPEQFNWGY